MIFGEYDREMDIAVNRREAREEGLEEGKLIITKNLLAEGSTPEFVQRITGLSLSVFCMLCTNEWGKWGGNGGKFEHPFLFYFV
jgi:hypothetical protein